MADSRDRRDFESQGVESHGRYASTRWYSVNEDLQKERDRDRERGRGAPPMERRQSDHEGAHVVREEYPRADGSIYVRETYTYRDRDDEIERDRRLPLAPAPPTWDDRRPGGRASSRVRFASPPREWDRDRADRDRESETERIDIREHYRDNQRDADRDREREWERERDPSDLEHDRRFVDAYTRIERSPYDRYRRPASPRHSAPVPDADNELLPFPTEPRYAADDFDRYPRRDRDRYSGPPRDADAYDRYGNDALYRDRYARTATEDDASRYSRISEHEIIRRDARDRDYRNKQQQHSSSRYYQDVSDHHSRDNAAVVSRPGFSRSRSMSLPPQSNPPPMKKIQIVTAMKPYKGTHTGDLTLLEGDLIRVTGKHGRHWLIGRNVDTQMQGFFPKEFVEGYESEEEDIDDDVRHYRNEPSASVAERSTVGAGYTPATVMVSNIPHNTTLKSDRPATVIKQTTYTRAPVYNRDYIP